MFKKMGSLLLALISLCAVFTAQAADLKEI